VRRAILINIISLVFIAITITVAQSYDPVVRQNQNQQTQRQNPNSNPPVDVQNRNNPGDQQQGQDKDRQNPLDQSLQEPQREGESGSRENILLPPDPDIEFQDFVASSLGYRLPIFGQNLFRHVPTTFAPLDRVPVTPDYLIGPGDELLVRAWGAIDINYRAVVDRTGSIYLPKVGAIIVAGLRYDQLNDFLKTAIGRIFKNFELNVTMGQLRSIQVFVVGQVRRPGSYTVSSLSTLVNTLFASGGPSKRGSMRHIQLKRAGKDVTTFDLYDLMVRGDKSKDAQLLPGDVIYVPPVGQLAALAGSVNVPGIYELKDHDTMGDVIANAGGITTTAAGQHAILERINERNVRNAEEIPLTPEGLKSELHDGDVVRFLHISPKFENTITLRGNVALPGRYPWHDGMRVKDLIPSRDSLITAEYWKRQNRLSLDVDSESFQLREEREKGTISTSPYKLDSKEGIETVQTQASAQQSLDRKPQELQTGASRDENLTQQVGRTEAQKIKGEELKNEVKHLTAEINWEYAVIQRLNQEDLTTQLIPFNLGKSIAGDERQNITLKPGDVITIFSQNDMQVPIGQQNKFVRLEGEFRAAGVYQVEPGESLRHLIVRVGGLTPQAYIFGSEFTRESTRESQQQRLDQYISDLEKEVERNAGAQKSLSGEEALVERQAQEGQRRLLDKLHQLKTTGRIVLEINPTANDIEAFPDLVLEDGDRLFVPFRFAAVYVLGNKNEMIVARIVAPRVV